MVSDSITANGSCSITTRSLKVPGSDSSQLATTCLGRPVSAATARHLTPVGKAAPPRPDRPESATAASTASGPISTARARAS